MSKKVDDSELQTLTLSPTNTNDDESSPFINPASDETAFPISPPPSYSSVTTSSSTLTGEKRKLERMVSAPSGSCSKPVPALRVSTPPGSSRITYTNERANERKMDLSKIIRERPTPSASIGQKKVCLLTFCFPALVCMACPCTFPPCCFTPLAAQHPPDTPRYKDHSASPGMKGLVVNAPNRKAVNLPWVRSPPPPPPIETQVGQKPSTSGTDVTPSGDHFTFASSTPVSPMPLLPMPPGRGTPSTVRSDASRAWLSRSGMRSGLRYRTGLDARKMDRPVQHHTFLADVADVRQIEQGLLQLMEDFQAGSLRAFGEIASLFIL
ncbi:Coiled-coil domain-containing protein 28A [Portunus trituberculatus]|uniref:Coiled-coil domain-containing protein 28A n=1 Tax=Portunus trituberculatus TaxID=210409 RepID=A0A5B7EAA4_PORTR|nr:Coiled-coil domain-containing protein 28A [Portunus trituberculatus]